MPRLSASFQATPPTNAVQSTPPSSAPAKAMRTTTIARAGETTTTDDEDFAASCIRRASRAVVLVLGFSRFVALPPGHGLIAWILGHMDLKEMDAGKMDPSGRGHTQTGKFSE